MNAIDATLPTHVEAEGEKLNPETAPVALTLHCDHPANAWRPAIRVSWYQGGMMPKSPKPYIRIVPQPAG